MELTKNFDHQQAEQKWYRHWLDKRYFHSEPDEHPENHYSIVIPPPNVTGVLHMGHCLNNTIQDILARHARMQGKNVCWVPGTDHASIATEAKVVQMLRERGIAKSSLTREEFLQYAWEWKEKYGGIILQQLKKLGCSLDWDRVNFTMDPEYYQSVINVFVDLYNKGLIYRGRRMINWDPKAKTALSDEEVIYREVQSKLYYVRYNITGEISDRLQNSPSGDEGITIATVRPETILGDTAICVHPDDERYKHLHGKFASVPLINRGIPIITDEYVDREFGTGALKITPAHDKADYVLAEKHNLEIIDVMNDDGTMSAAAQLFVGEDSFEARKKIVAALETSGHLVKIEDYTNQIGFSERSDAIVEDRISLQWWLKMKPLAEPALKAVMDDEIKFYPAKFKNLYKHWMENIKDWCISRQLWWGHRIPAWYDKEGNAYIAANAEEALKLAHSHNSQLTTHDLKQDEDVTDTWFSAWLWPFEVFKGFSHPGNADIKYYYPTNTLVTAPEIIFFWVARMIMAGLEYQKGIPFRDVYFTGIVRDKLGRKMSKQLGNSPDLLGLIDKYGADAVRFGIMISSPAGNDLLFDEASVEQGRNFNNKLWNAMKLVKIWEERKTDEYKEVREYDFANEWFENRLNQVKSEVKELYRNFKLSEVLKTIYVLIWDDFCSSYLEWVKPGEYRKHSINFEKTIYFFEELLQLLHPFMPFVTEEIYHLLKDRNSNDNLIVKQYTKIESIDLQILYEGEILKKVISAIREFRSKNQISYKEKIDLNILPHNDNYSAYEKFRRILPNQVNSTWQLNAPTLNNANKIAVEKDTLYIYSEKTIDKKVFESELQNDLEYQKNFLQSVLNKLSNERFVQNARPEVVELEKKKKADAEARIKTIEESLANLN